jgi:hypothetical protein
MMGGIKNYMRQLMTRILEESGFEGDAQQTIDSLSQSLETMSNEQYMRAIASAFSGKGDMGGVEDFVNSDFQMPDLSENKSDIYNGVTDYLNKNLAELGLEGDQIESVVTAVQDELKKTQGPDFYALPQLFA